MNPNLDRLQPYPFQKLSALFKNLAPRPDSRSINLSIGEPKHPTPEFIKCALAENLEGLAAYPATGGSEPLRTAIAGWLRRRYGLADLSRLLRRGALP
jgi:N-succinyldiaminopimelate aminotransferase